MSEPDEQEIETEELNSHWENLVREISPEQLVRENQFENPITLENLATSCENGVQLLTTATNETDELYDT